jgi:hypothetical protein
VIKSEWFFKQLIAGTYRKMTTLKQERDKYSFAQTGPPRNSAGAKAKQFVLLIYCIVWINRIAEFLYDEKREDFDTVWRVSKLLIYAPLG